MLGSTGMLGHMVVSYLSSYDEIDVFDISYKNKLRESTIIVDAMSSSHLEEEILDLQPDYIVNCIGILIKGSQDVTRATYLNSYLPHQLKNFCETIDGKLIHISTDCVFSGNDGQYKESDFRDGQGVYAQTKILGEIIDDKHLTIRTSIVGPELKSNGEGLFHWFMMQIGEIGGFKNAIWSGVTTLELAKAIKWSIDNNIAGLYHLTNNSIINKYDLLKLFKKHTKKEINILPIEDHALDKSFIDSRLLINYRIPSYDDMVFSMIEEIKINKSLYSQYNI